jgi:hypothetical protein
MILSLAAYVAAEFSLGAATRVSDPSGGGVASGDSSSPTQSPNSSFLAFASNASNLDANDVNGRQNDIFIKDLSKGSLFPISINDNFTFGNGASEAPSISPVTPEGTYAVAFESLATNLMTAINDTNSRRDIYVRLPTELKTFLVSLSEEGVLADGNSFSPSVIFAPNPETLAVAYASDATNLVTGDTNGRRDIFLATIPLSELSSTNPLASLSIRSSAMLNPPPDGDSDEPELSGNAQRLVFSSTATNLLAGQTITGRQIYLVEEIEDGILVSKSSSGTPGNGSSKSPSISFNGRFVAFITNSSNLTSDNDAGIEIAVRVDVSTGEIVRVDTTPEGTPGDAPVLDCAISSNGRFVTFTSGATNLSSISGGRTNVYVKDLETGDLTLISQGANGAVPNANSSSGVFITPSFSSLSGQVVFVSQASNITSDTPSGNADLFSVPLTSEAPPISKDTKIEVPPDVTVTTISETKRTISLSLLTFRTSTTPSSSARGETSLRLEETIEAARPPKRIIYDVRLTASSGRKRDNRSKLTRRNQVAFRGVKPGTYSARYRVIVMRGEKVVSRTPFSPRRRFDA